MKAILDTSFLFALKNRDDKNFSKALSLLKRLKRLDFSSIITSHLVLEETYTLMMYRTKGNIQALNSLDNLFWGSECFFRIYNFDLSEYRQIADFMRKYSSSKKLLSFVDASIIYLSNILKIDYIVSFDSHFDHIVKNVLSLDE